MDYLWTWTRTLMRTTKVGMYLTYLIFLARAAEYIQTCKARPRTAGEVVIVVIH